MNETDQMSKPVFPHVRIVVDLGGPDGNAFAVMASRRCAMPGSIRARLMITSKRAMAGDYDNLLKRAWRRLTSPFPSGPQKPRGRRKGAPDRRLHRLYTREAGQGPGRVKGSLADMAVSSRSGTRDGGFEIRMQTSPKRPNQSRP